jgi:hypothetical protein
MDDVRANWNARMLTVRNEARLDKIIPALSDEQKADAARIVRLAKVSGRIIPRIDYDRIMNMLRTHDPDGSVKGHNGLVKVDTDRSHKLSAKLEMLSTRGNQRAKELLSQIAHSRIKKELRDEALVLVRSHRMAKSTGKNINQALFVVFQACENLAEGDFSRVEERDKVIFKLGASARALLEVQSKLMERFDD